MTDFSTQQDSSRDINGFARFQRRQCAAGLNGGAIMAAAPAEKAVMPRAPLRQWLTNPAGLGIAIFGLLLSRSFSARFWPPVGLNPQEIERASSSMGEAVLAHSLPSSLSEALLLSAAKEAFYLVAQRGL